MRFLRESLLQAAVACAYVGAGKLGLLVPAGHQIITLVWAPTGIALVAVLLLGYRILPALVAGAFLTNLTAGAPPLVACAIAVGNPLEAAIAAALLRAAGFRAGMDRTRDVLALLLFGAGISTTVSATIGVAALHAASQLPPGALARNWLDWWLGDAMGDLIVAPLLLAGIALVQDPARSGFAKRPLEALGVTAVVGGAGAAVFLLSPSRSAGQETAFIVFPLLIAAALRFGPPGAAAASFLTVTIAVAGTLLGRGPFGDMTSRAAIAHLHLFMGTAAVSALLLAASLAEREAAQEETRRSEEGARQARKMEALGLLASGIAGEFSKSLAIIRERARILASHIALDDPMRPSLEGILRAAESAEESTRRIVAFGRRGGGVAASVSPDASIRGMLPVVGPLLGESIALELEIEKGLPFVRIDAGQLEQVLLSLVLNARDAMPQGGRLAIRAARAVSGPGHVELSVSDTGRGMDEAARRRLFEPYFTTKPEGQRGGLGLAMVHAIVTRAGGSAEAWSEPGRGTRLTVRLPAVPRSRPAAGGGPWEADSRGGQETILVVDGVESSWREAMEILAPRGYEVLVASSGARALEVFRRHQGRVELILVAVELPDMPGGEVASRLMLERPGLRALFTAPRRAGGGDPGRVLLKPFTPGELAGRVRQELDAWESPVGGAP